MPARRYLCGPAVCEPPSRKPAAFGPDNDACALRRERSLTHGAILEGDTRLGPCFVQRQSVVPGRRRPDLEITMRQLAMWLIRVHPGQASPTVAPLFAKNLEQAKVPVSVELGSTELLFQELAVLEVGDFIKLDQEITKPLKIKVNDRVKFLGRPGVRESRIAIQLIKVLQEGDEEFEE